MTEHSREHSESPVEGPNAGERGVSTSRAHTQDPAEGPDAEAQSGSVEEGPSRGDGDSPERSGDHPDPALRSQEPEPTGNSRGE